MDSADRDAAGAPGVSPGTVRTPRPAPARSAAAGSAPAHSTTIQKG